MQVLEPLEDLHNLSMVKVVLREVFSSCYGGQFPNAFAVWQMSNLLIRRSWCLVFVPLLGQLCDKELGKGCTVIAFHLVFFLPGGGDNTLENVIGKSDVLPMKGSFGSLKTLARCLLRVIQFPFINSIELFKGMTTSEGNSNK